MSEPLLEIGLDEDGITVLIRRQDEVSDSAWLQLRAVWSLDGRDAARSVTVPIERFMATRTTLSARCREVGVGVQLNDRLRAAMANARETRTKLDASLAAGASTVDGVVEVLASSRFRRELRSFQIRDLGRLLALSNGANFSVPGAGKTTVAYALYEAERVRGRVDRLLVVAPLSAFEAWLDEATECLDPVPRIARYTGGRIPADAEVLLVNYERLVSSYTELAAWVARHKTLVLLDEAHRMKRGWNGERGTACLNLAYLATRRDILTGTPAPQGPGDMVALIDYLWPNEARRILPSAALASTPSPDAGAMVAKAIAPLYVRTNKADLGLPPVTHRSILVPLEGIHAEIYAGLRDRYAGSLTASPREQLDLLAMGRIVMYLLEAATNPKLLASGSADGADPDVFRHPPLPVEPGSRLADLIERYNLYETPRKFIELMRLVKANADAGRKTLVWSNFVRNLRVLERMLERYQPALIHGGVPAYAAKDGDRSRETEINRFRKDADCLVLLANPAAMSEGVSLHRECHDAIYLERTFNAGQYIQSVDRIHRLGLDEHEDTRITFLLTAGTVDETVDRRVRIKAERLGQMLDDPNLAAVVLPDDEDYGPAIDPGDDIAALFAHLRGDDAG